MSTFKKFVAYSLIFIICSMSFLGSVVSVYADSVTSLPAHSDIVSSFDANNIYLETPDGSYTISRQTLIPTYKLLYSTGKVRQSSCYFFTDVTRGGIFTAIPSSFSYSVTYGSIFMPRYFEYDYSNRSIYASYWYSPSSNMVYIINSAYSSYYGCSSAKVLSYYSSSSGSSFYIDVTNVPGLTNVFVTLYDLNSGHAWNSLGESFSSSCRTSLSSFYYDEDYVAVEDRYGNPQLNLSSFPGDLVCIYSNYQIPGFWEIDPTANIVTPDYYFTYQYLIQGVDNYIIFIDSSKPIINFDSSDGTIRFSDLCNKRIYVTTDGVSWTNLVTSGIMYSSAYSLASKYYKSDNPDDPFSFRLIYSNDESYGEEPLVKPEFNSSFTKFDFYSKFPSFIEEYIEGETDWPNAYHTLFPSSGTENLSGLKAFLYGSFSGINDALIALGYSSDTVSGFIDDLFDVSSISFSDAFTANIFNNLTQEFNYQYDISGNLVSRTRTIYGYLKNVSENLYDTKLLIEQFRLDILTPLGSIFDISSFNADRLVDITALIKGIKIPDYSKKLDTIITSLASLSGPVFDDSVIIAAINKITIPDYSSKLDAIISRPFFDDSGIIAAINNAAFDDTAILDAINNISIPSGGGSSPTVSVDLDKLYKLLDFDISDYDDDKTDDDTRVVDFVVDGLNDLVSGTVLQDALDFAPGVLSGIVLVNGFVVNIYDNLGNYKPVVLLGLTFTVVGTVIRKEE